MTSMGSGAPKRIHIATRAYLDRWSERGRVVMHDKLTGRVEERRPEKVAWRRDWWGEDRRVAAAVEQALSVGEGDAAKLLRRVPESWPPSSTDRALLAEFVALHIVRGDDFRVLVLRSMHEGTFEYARSWKGTPEALARELDVVGSPVFLADMILQRIPALASMVASMHWSLVRFDGIELATSDQPAVPASILAPGRAAGISVTPASGMANIIELRFPLSPTLLLLCSWSHLPEGAPIEGTPRQAADLNRAASEAAARQWVARPGSRTWLQAPPFREDTCQAVAPQLLDGYGDRAALRSDRRQRATELMQTMMRERDYDHVHYVDPCGNAAPLAA